MHWLFRISELVQFKASFVNRNSQFRVPPLGCIRLNTPMLKLRNTPACAGPENTPLKSLVWPVFVDRLVLLVVVSVKS